MSDMMRNISKKRKAKKEKGALYEAMKALLRMNKGILDSDDTAHNKVEALKRLSKFVGEKL